MGKKKRLRTITAAPTSDELPSRILGDPRVITSDAFANSLAKLGIGEQNLSAGGTYNFEPISRNRQQLENAYRGSWIVRKAVDIIPEDMTREGIKIQSDLPPDAIDKFYVSFSKKGIWKELTRGLKWARLYGGAIVVLQIDGQDLSSPLRPETIGLGQFLGLRALDRWMIQPAMGEGELITEPGPKQGLPCYYDIVVESGGLPKGRVHHSRVIRFEGNDLPFYQRQMENGWGLSVLEPLWDRLMAFDSTFTGAAQLVFKAHLRTVYIEGFHQAASIGGPAYEGLKRRMSIMQTFQNSEGMSVMDSKEKLETTAYAFGGLDSILIQMSQQVAGSVDVPMTRFFGQSPAGMNATGDSDTRNHYDKIKEMQEDDLREPVDLILKCEHQSQFAGPPGPDFGFEFQSLWQLNDSEKAQIGAQITHAVIEGFSSGVVDKPIAMKELNQSADVTGLWSNITDDDIEAAALAPPPMPGLDPSGGMGGQPPGGRFEGGLEGGTPPSPPPGGPPGGANPDIEALHAAVKGKSLTGTEPAAGLTLKPAHELELLHHTIKGETLSGPEPAKSLLGPDLEDLHDQLRGKSLTGDAEPQSRNEIIQAAQMIPHEEVMAAMKAGLSYEAALELYGWKQRDQTVTLDDDPDQPREPKGKSTGGQWTKEGGGGSGVPPAPTNSPAFKQWFGNSKVVDDDGKPLVLYHGTNKDFDIFKSEFMGGTGPYSFGFHFTSRANEASTYADSLTNSAVKFNPNSKFAVPVRSGANVMPVYLQAEHPLEIDTSEIAASMEADRNKAGILARLDEAQKAGTPYDSVIIKKKGEWGGLNVIVFEPEQVKSAIGNKGTFDPKSAAIGDAQS